MYKAIHTAVALEKEYIPITGTKSSLAATPIDCAQEAFCQTYVTNTHYCNRNHYRYIQGASNNNADNNLAIGKAINNIMIVTNFIHC